MRIANTPWATLHVLSIAAVEPNGDPVRGEMSTEAMRLWGEISLELQS